MNLSGDILAVYAFTAAVITGPRAAVTGSTIRTFVAARLLRALVLTVAEVEFTVTGEVGGEPPVLEFALYDEANEPILPPALAGPVMSHVLMHPSLYDFWIERTAMFALLGESPLLDVTQTLAEVLFCHEAAEHLIATTIT